MNYQTKKMQQCMQSMQQSYEKNSAIWEITFIKCWGYVHAVYFVEVVYVFLFSSSETCCIEKPSNDLVVNNASFFTYREKVLTVLCFLVKALQTTAFCSFWRKCQIWSSCMVSTHDTWRGDESEATRLSVYLESWRRYKPVPVCWSVCRGRMISWCRDAQYLQWQRV